ncbi:hypothetical protein RJT34_30791 [Clitoria ternatea]|uniref:Uncharacterized protein n=1 Tax=Clitoria ternatea TaxID=43366 RepID=A0AAN9ET35_CLITE
MLCKNKGTLQDIIHPSIKGQIDQNSFKKFSETVEKCIQEIGSARPNMGDVLWDLENALRIQQGAINRELQDHVKMLKFDTVSLSCVKMLKLELCLLKSAMNGANIVGTIDCFAKGGLIHLAFVRFLECSDLIDEMSNFCFHISPLQ